jgi:hypothetical protein
MVWFSQQSVSQSVSQLVGRSVGQDQTVKRMPVERNENQDRRIS